MKIEVKQTTETISHVEIELPYYSKHGCHFYKVYSETECVQICTLSGYEHIASRPSSHAFGKDDVQCTEKEYTKAFNQVLKLLKS